MKNTHLFRLGIFVLAGSLLLSACKRDKDEDPDADTSIASDNALAERSFSDAQRISEEAADGSLTSFLNPVNGDSRQLLSACATITFDSSSTPGIITIDFGTTNCLCSDGRYRRGIINVAYTGAYRDSASVHTITFNNYYVNDNKLTGTKTVTNMGHNSSGNLWFTVVVNGTVTKPDGGTITWNSNRTRTWIMGESTMIWNDDAYDITGTASGTTSGGKSFTATVLTPLRLEIDCRHFVSGSFQLTPSGKPVRTVDYGSGACDNIATVAINGNVYTINLN
jgi:hypothetical protein